MKAVKETIRKYYKYQYNDWVQPILTANGTMDENSFAVAASTSESSYPPYKAFDKITSSRWGATSSTVPQWISWYNPKPLKITDIAIANRSDTPNHLASGIIQACDDNVSWVNIKEWTNDVSERGAVWNIDLSNNVKSYKYYRLYISKYNISGDTTYVSIPELTITAQEQAIVESSESDYDFYEDIDIYKLPTKTARMYYKYQYHDWIQPVLTANGTMGGDNFAVTTYQAWDGNASTFAQFFTNGENETFFYNPRPLKISTMKFTYYPTCWISKGEIYGSNDGSSYTLLTEFSHNSNSETVEVNNETPYKYFKIKIINANGNNGHGYLIIADIIQIDMTAQEKVIIEGTESDYDFYKDKITYYGIGD